MENNGLTKRRKNLLFVLILEIKNFKKELTSKRKYYKTQTIVLSKINVVKKVEIYVVRTKFYKKDVFLWKKKRMKLFYLKTKD